MFELSEHASFEHSSRDWWMYTPRATSGKTCLTCLSLYMTHYRGDEVELAFPYHIHVAVNKIRVMVHPNCRCVLWWTGRTEEPWERPFGWLQGKPKAPEIPTKVYGRPVEDELSPSQDYQRKQITKYAREVWRHKN